MVQHPDQLGDLPWRAVPIVAELLCWDLPVMDHAQDLALAEPEVPRGLLRAERPVHPGEAWCLLFLHACRLPSSGVTSHPPMERDALGLPDIRMLSAGVGASGRVCRPVPTVRIGRNGPEFPQGATVPSQAPKPRIHKAD